MTRTHPDDAPRHLCEMCRERPSIAGANVCYGCHVRAAQEQPGFPRPRRRRRPAEMPYRDINTACCRLAALVTELVERARACNASAPTPEQAMAVVRLIIDTQEMTDVLAAHGAVIADEAERVYESRAA